MSAFYQQCGSESRAFFVVDSLTPGRLLWIQKALVRLGSTLAVTLKQPCPIGIAVLQRPKPGQAAQLQIILRLSPMFQVKEYITCVKRLLPSDDEAAADGAVLGSALYALVQHMQKLPARQDCQNHLFIISSSFASCTNNPKMQRLLQVTEPVSGLQTEAEHSICDDEQYQQQGAAQETGVKEPMCDLDFATLLRSLHHCDNITYDEFFTDCEAVAELICQSWLRELLAPCYRSSRSSSTDTPDIVIHFGEQVLHCSLQQHILQLEPWLLPAHLCPCHHLPMQPGIVSSSAATAYAAATATASDGGSTAALLTLPEVCPWLCCISGQPVRVPLSSCPCDARILQLGRHTQLAVPPPPTAAAAPVLSDASAVTGHAGNHTNHKLRMLQALPLAPHQPLVLHVQHLVAPSAVDGMLLFGMPLLLTPANSGNATPGALQAIDAGLQQSHFGHQHKPAAEAEMLMRALCQLLLEQQEVLLAVSNHDLIRRIQLPLQQWYLLQPAADGSSLLLRNIASTEQLLPPNVRGNNGLGRSMGSTSKEGMDEQVVLLDAQQLESVKSSLAGLKRLGDAISSGCTGTHAGNVPGSGTVPGAIMPGRRHATAVESDQEGSTAHAGAGCQRMPTRNTPLLLSCGLDTWVSAVLEASSATYMPPSPKPLPVGPMLLPGPGSVPPQVHVTSGASVCMQGTADHTRHQVHAEGQQAAQPIPATCQTTVRPQLQQHVDNGASAADHHQQKQNDGKPEEAQAAVATAACNAQEVPVVNDASSAVPRGQTARAGSRASRGKRSSTISAASTRKLRLSKV